MSTLTCRIESPITLAKDDTATGESWLHLFTAGHYLKGTWKEFAIDTKDFDSMIRKYRTNLSSDNGTQVVVDYNHASAFSSGDDSKAAGWVVDEPTALKKRNKGTELWAKVSLTEKARKEIKAGEWRYISPEFIPRKSMFDDRERTPQLLAIALTNRPATELAEIDSTMLSFHICESTLNEEDEMTADEIRAMSEARDLQPYFSVRLSNLEQPPVQGQVQGQAGVQGAGMVDADELGKAVALAVGNAVKEQIEPISTKLNQFESERQKEARERQINKTLSKHVERGAVTPEQISAIRDQLMLSTDDEAFVVALQAQDAILSAIPSKEGDMGEEEAPDKPMISLNGDGDISDNSVGTYVPMNTIQGTGQADSTVLSIQKFVDGKKAEGVSEVEAHRLAHRKFGDDKFAAFTQVDDSEFGKGALDASAAG